MELDLTDNFAGSVQSDGGDESKGDVKQSATALGGVASTKKFDGNPVAVRTSSTKVPPITSTVVRNVIGSPEVQQEEFRKRRKESYKLYYGNKVVMK